MGEVICNCNYIEKEEITEFLEENPDADIEAVKRETGAGTSCGRCLDNVKQIMEELNMKK